MTLKSFGNYGPYQPPNRQTKAYGVVVKDRRGRAVGYGDATGRKYLQDLKRHIHREEPHRWLHINVVSIPFDRTRNGHYRLSDYGHKVIQ